MPSFIRPFCRSAELTHHVLGWKVALCALLTGGGVLLAGASVHAELAELYRLTDLGTLGGTQSYAYGINNAGQVVGWSTTPKEVQRAFVYSSGTMADLGTLGGTYSNATGINAAGQVVGTANTKDDAASRAFIYSNGTMTDLGTLGGSTSGAFGINASGQVVGFSYIGDATNHAFVYSNGTMTDLGTLGGSGSDGFGINDAGQAVGKAFIKDDAADQPFVFSNGVMTDLGSLGGIKSQALGINAGGDIVGWSTTAGGAAHAFVLSNGTMTDLGTLGGISSQANGINTAGDVVGTFNTNPVGADLNAFLYRHGSLVNLNSLLDSNANGWTLQEATAINDNRQIVGYGLNPLGQTRAFLMTPVPLPGSVILFGAGLVALMGLGVRSWRQSRPSLT